MKTRRSTRLHKEVSESTDDEVTILNPAKKEKMELPNQVNPASFIKIEQLVKHDVWDIRKKDGGVFVMKKVNEGNTAACPNISGFGVTAASGKNPEQLGARPKTAIQVPKKSIFAVNTRKNDFSTQNPVAAPLNRVTTKTTTVDLENDVITLDDSSASPMGLFTVNNAITMKTTAAPKAEVIIINTDSSSKTKEVASSQRKVNFGVLNEKQQTEPNIWGIQSEASKIQEMFPAFPLSQISNYLKITGSTEITIEHILNGMLIPSVPTFSQDSQVPLSRPTSSTAASSVPPVVQLSDDEVILEESVANTKKGGTVIKIELLTQNEVWDIQRKDNEGFVMTKVGVGDVSRSQKTPTTNDNFTEAMDEECDEFLTDDVYDDTVYKSHSDNVKAPMKIMVYSQTSNKKLPVSKTGTVANHNEGKIDASMEVDNFNSDHLNPEEKMSVDSFDFSDDENESGETIELLLFRASLALEKLKYLNGAESQERGESALLNITGGRRNEEERGGKEEESESASVEEAKEGEDSDSDDDYYTDEEEDEECKST